MSTRKITGALLLGIGGLMMGNIGYIHAKAQLAQYLIADAWQQTIATGQPVPPWSWADFSPIAKLSFTSSKPLFVLKGSHGQSLAFGPGHLTNSTMPGDVGQVVIAAHNDSHFVELKNVHVGNIISLQSRSGITRHYRITDKTIFDVKQQMLRRSDRDELILITCYPFNNLRPNTPLRLVVRGTPIVPSTGITAKL